MDKDQTEQGIYFLNRYTGEVEREKVMSESCLRWIYGSSLGRASLHLLFKRAFFSKLLGCLKNRPSSKREIKPFVDEYGIDMSESLLGIDDFKNFNEFFYRKLKPGSRPLPAQENAVVFPADARHMGWQNASEIKGVFVKNQCFDLPALLGDKQLADLYAEGSVILSRLCPTDYHRFHFVADGTPSAPRLINGPLASVSPYALRGRLAWLWTNKRSATVIENHDLGKVLMLEVGATGVGSILQTYKPGVYINKGDEKGYFAFGGSTVMIFFEPGRIQLCQDLINSTNKQQELYARQGDMMGVATAY